ncbi:MAG: helix-turn-helix domain-containing protein [Flavobacteriaceae bacterium]|nr:helix-turn-helix domain-containing protein [Flavobacteriaceae bacterium]
MSEITIKRGYAIGEMSRQTGVNIETIRYYERIGIIPKPDRTEGGNRQYNHDELKRLSFVRRCRELGFSLNEIRALLEMADRDDFTCNEVHDMTASHLINVKKKLNDLKRLERVLKGMVAECSKGDVPDCPIIDTLFELK